VDQIDDANATNKQHLQPALKPVGLSHLTCPRFIVPQRRLQGFPSPAGAGIGRANPLERTMPSVSGIARQVCLIFEGKRNEKVFNADAAIAACLQEMCSFYPSRRQSGWPASGLELIYFLGRSRPVATGLPSKEFLEWSHLELWGVSSPLRRKSLSHRGPRYTVRERRERSSRYRQTVLGIYFNSAKV